MRQALGEALALPSFTHQVVTMKMPILREEETEAQRASQEGTDPRLEHKAFKVYPEDGA